MPQHKSKKQKYEILVTSTLIQRICVEAPSPEEACRTLQRKISGKPFRDTDVSSVIVEHVWSDPSQSGEDWIVATDQQAKENPSVLMTWDGKEIHTHDAEEIIGNVFRNVSRKGGHKDGNP